MSLSTSGSVSALPIRSANPFASIPDNLLRHLLSYCPIDALCALSSTSYHIHMEIIRSQMSIYAERNPFKHDMNELRRQVEAFQVQTSMTYLNLKNNRFIKDEDLKLITQLLPDLRRLNFTGTKISGGHLHELTGLETLEKLNLSKTLFNAADLSKIALLTTLKSIDLSHSNVSTELQQLQPLPLLEELILRNCSSINDQTLEDLKGFSHLKRIDLVWDSVYPQNSLACAPQEELFDHIANYGFIDKIRSVKFNFCYRHVPDSVLDNIAGNLWNLTQLSLCSARCSVDNLTNLTSLFFLEILEVRNVENLSCEYLTGFTNLRYLDASFTPISADLVHLTKLERLETLLLHGCANISRRELPFFKQIKQLRILDIAGSIQIGHLFESTEDINEIFLIPNLRQLNICNRSYGQINKSAFIPSLSIRKLHLSHSHRTINSFIRCIPSLTNLFHLCLERLNIQEDDFRAIVTNCTELITLDLAFSRNTFPNEPSFFSLLTKLESLDITGWVFKKSNSVNAFAGLVNLRNLKCSNCFKFDLNWIDKLKQFPILETLETTCLGSIDSIRQLAQISTLREIRIETATEEGFDNLTAVQILRQNGIKISRFAKWNLTHISPPFND